jgi:hypothetical protein
MNKINHIATLIFSLILTSYSHATDAPPELPDRENFKVFLLAGQSNMAGRGELTEEDKEIHPRVLMLAKDGSWEYAVDPIHYDKKNAGTGLAKSFAIELAERDENITIGLVPAACGGSSITHWQPGVHFDKTDSYPYDDAISRTRRAMQDGTLSGILWHQGESDSNAEKAGDYKRNLIDTVERFRKDLDAPEVPFIIGQLGRFDAKPWTESRYKVNQAHAEVANEIPYVGFVSAWGLTSEEDNTHFNTDSLHEFGRRYAKRYLLVASEGHREVFH